MKRHPSVPLAVYLTTAALFVLGCWRVYVLGREDQHSQWWARRQAEEAGKRVVNDMRKAGVL